MKVTPRSKLAYCISSACLLSTLCNASFARDRNYFNLGEILSETEISNGWRLVETTEQVNFRNAGNVCIVRKNFSNGTTLALGHSVQLKSGFISISNRKWASLANFDEEKIPLIITFNPGNKTIYLDADVISNNSYPELSADISNQDLSSFQEKLSASSSLQIVARKNIVFEENIEGRYASNSLEACTDSIKEALASDPFRN